MMLRTLLWALAGSVGAFSAAFVLIAVLLASGLCGPSPNGTSCSGMLGVLPLVSALIGAIVFGWFSRTDIPGKAKRRMQFGRMAAPDRE